MIATSTPPEWVLHPRSHPQSALLLARDLEAPPAIGHWLVNRGLADPARARQFLSPVLEDLHDPMRLLGLDRALERIQRAIAHHERILVQGDYDVDGITSTYLLHTAISDLGGNVRWRIPHRTRDGYGLTSGAVDEAQRAGCTLIVTVDCGITAVEPVARARALGIDTVITDHHEPPLVLPAACAVVNPLQPGCGYPFKSLAGVGVTFKLVEALLREGGRGRRAEDFLEVVALGTIADVVPLVGENRILATLGLERLNRTGHLGLRALLERANLAGRRVSSGQVAFVLAPRINAAGRMGDASQALRLLLARDEGEARACAESLEDDNERRRAFDGAAAIQAAERVEKELGWPDCASILLWSEDWHPGVLGIVASRLVERFQRPTLLVALDGDRGRGSGRSLPGLDLIRVLDGCGDLLEAYGGHALAAGITVTRDRLPELRERLERLVRERVSPGDLVRKLEFDCPLSLAECDQALVEWVDRLAPHGLDNPEPLYHLPHAEVVSTSVVGGGKHLRLTVRDGTAVAEAIGFGMGGEAEAVRQAGVCSILFVPTRNEWNGASRLQLKLKGIRRPAEPFASAEGPEGGSR
ncbi:MAG TPA: single-stranded-DNA-specific exonuclease RecJ [Candidatus Eisenbacteria bacterium]|nr:single-stranded-DNA-specific exonuclease RecJ [Candidatus Eisenbacteria bacterium]